MRYDETIKDIKIAKDKLKAQKLDDAFKEEDLILEAYCIPSHNHFAYYARIYESEGKLKMVYVHNEITSLHYGFTIRMYPFAAALEAEEKANLGDFYIGIATLSIDNENRVCKLLSKFPKESYVASKKGIILDGTYQYFKAVKKYKEISYYCACEVLGDDASSEEIDLFEEFNTFLEEQMG